MAKLGAAGRTPRSYGIGPYDANEKIAALAAICRRVDGIRLAIELAAARARLLGLPGLVKHLEHPLELLTDRARDSPGGRRTLGATFDWSYELLLDSDKRVFRHMGVFIGGCTYATAARVCGTNVDDTQFLNALERVVESGFVRRIESHDTRGPRLQLFESVREYALERLRECGEDDVAHRLQASAYLDLAELAARDAPSSRDPSWQTELTEEHGNALAALRWLLTNTEVTYSLRLLAALSKFWWVQGSCASPWSISHPDSPRANWKCCVWWRMAIPTKRSPRICTSVSRRWNGILRICTGRLARATAATRPVRNHARPGAPINTTYPPQRDSPNSLAFSLRISRFQL